MRIVTINSVSMNHRTVDKNEAALAYADLGVLPILLVKKLLSFSSSINVSSIDESSRYGCCRPVYLIEVSIANCCMYLEAGVKVIVLCSLV